MYSEGKGGLNCAIICLPGARHERAARMGKFEGVWFPVAEYVGTPGGGAALKDKQKVSRPKRYKVLLLNDHYTTMEFVVDILVQVFRRSESEAYTIMLSVHENGIGVAGVYIKAIAEAKIQMVHDLARDHQFPLRCTMEQE